MLSGMALNSFTGPFAIAWPYFLWAAFRRFFSRVGMLLYGLNSFSAFLASAQPCFPWRKFPPQARQICTYLLRLQ
jgi:hypothetical protein